MRSQSLKSQTHAIQLTIQGQTISSNFGTPESCQYNMEQLLSSGIANAVFASESEMSKEDRETMTRLADISYKAYTDFKAHRGGQLEQDVQQCH